MFFVLEKKDWEKIKVPEQRENAYDEYGLSLIAILVDVEENDLLKSTLRWNHVIEPQLTNNKQGIDVDRAFIGWADLNEVVGFDVKEKSKEKISNVNLEIKKKNQKITNEVFNYLKNSDIIHTSSILNKYKYKLTYLNIPDNVKEIGGNAFLYFNALKKVTIPNSVTIINDNAFNNCQNLISINFPSSIKIVEKYAFNGCYNLKKVLIDDLRSWCEIDFKNAYSNPFSTTYFYDEQNIDPSLILNNQPIENLKIPDGIQEIKRYSFYRYSRLKTLEMSNSILKIGSMAFGGCENLQSIKFSKNIQNIDRDAFVFCKNLKSLEFPDNLKIIQPHAFSGCKNLTSIRIPKSIEYIGFQAFEFCNNLQTIEIPEKFKDKIWNKEYDIFGLNGKNITYY